MLSQLEIPAAWKPNLIMSTQNYYSSHLDLLPGWYGQDSSLSYINNFKPHQIKYYFKLLKYSLLLCNADWQIFHVELFVISKNNSRCTSFFVAMVENIAAVTFCNWYCFASPASAFSNVLLRTGSLNVYRCKHSSKHAFKQNHILIVMFAPTLTAEDVHPCCAKNVEAIYCWWERDLCTYYPFWLQVSPSIHGGYILTLIDTVNSTNEIHINKDNCE